MFPFASAQTYLQIGKYFGVYYFFKAVFSTNFLYI